MAIVPYLTLRPYDDGSGWYVEAQWLGRATEQLLAEAGAAAAQMSPMDDLTAQLEALLLRHARWVDHSGPAAFERSLEQFRMDMRRLIAEFGHATVDAALDDMPDEPWPSASLH
jgi:hypothetical protein